MPPLAPSSAGRWRVWSHAPALLLFCALTLVLTYPVVRQLRSALPRALYDRYQQACDPQLATWAMTWGLRHLVAGDWTGLWNANILHPAPGTLAYSEHFLGEALLGAPAYWLSGEPLVLYNVVFLLSFGLTAFATYLLVYDLTGRRGAGIVAGTIFGFCSFRSAHLNHLHLLASYGMPLALLGFRKLIERRSFGALAGFLGALVLQLWSSLHYGLMVTVVLIVIGAGPAVRAFRVTPVRLTVAAGVALAALALTQGPILQQYQRVHREAGFHRTIVENLLDSAEVQGYVAAPPSNRWLGPLTSRLARTESWLYPGVIAAVLALWGLRDSFPRRPWPRWTRLDVAAPLGFLIASGIRLALPAGPPQRVSWPLVTMSAALVFLAWRAARAARVREYFARLDPGQATFYVALTLVSAVLSLGPIIRLAGFSVAYGPYALLYWLVPGFGAIRAPGRFHMLTMLGVAVLAGYAVAAGERRWKRSAIVVAALVALIAVDYAAIPLGTAPQPRAEALPDAYRWLTEQPGDFAVVELPLLPGDQPTRGCDLLYYSIYHRKKIVNGYSGYFPAEGGWLQRQVEEAGISLPVVEYLRQIGVRYIFVRHGTPIDPAAGVHLRHIRRFTELVVHEIVAGSVPK
jgi:hypothetical protein